jgi:hypothetical protein
MMPIGQKLLPTPNMVGQTYRQRRTPTPITTPRRTILSTLTQTPMRTQPVALKHTQYHSRIPQTHPLRKRVRLARQTVQTIPQHPIQPLAVNPIRTRNRRTQHTTHRHTHCLAPTTTLDRLCQAHSCRRHSARTPMLAQTLRVPIHALHLLPIDHPPIPDPRYALVSRRPSPVRSHRPMVSCLCAMMFSAALRLPRRITTSRVRATSVGGASDPSVCQRRRRRSGCRCGRFSVVVCFCWRF